MGRVASLPTGMQQKRYGPRPGQAPNLLRHPSHGLYSPVSTVQEIYRKPQGQREQRVGDCVGQSPTSCPERKPFAMMSHCHWGCLFSRAWLINIVEDLVSKMEAQAWGALETHEWGGKRRKRFLGKRKLEPHPARWTGFTWGGGKHKRTMNCT